MKVNTKRFRYGHLRVALGANRAKMHLRDIVKEHRKRNCNRLLK